MDGSTTAIWDRQRTIEFWKDFYEKHPTILDASQFAKFCLDKFVKKKTSFRTWVW